MIRTRVVALLAVLPIIGALCYAAYRFGPGPTGNPVHPEVNDPPAAKPATTGPSPSLNTQLFQAFGMYETAIGKGQVEVSVAEHLDSIEAIYRQRGYEKLTPGDAAKRTRWRSSQQAKPRAQKFFHRQETGGISTIWATGNDADYTTDRQAAEPFSFSTLVTPSASGGAEWATYRMELDQEKIKQLSNLEDGDFPGTDPLNIPRPPGLQRIYAFGSTRGTIAIYRSYESETSLMMQYLRELPRRGWHLDPEVTANANKLASGVMCFTKGQRFCMIWITRGKDAGTTNVTISSH